MQKSIFSPHAVLLDIPLQDCPQDTLHDNGHMVIHVLVNITQKARRNDAHPAKGNANQVHPPVALRKGNLPRSDDDLPSRVIAGDARYQPEFFEEGGAGEDDGRFDGFGVRDAEFELHGAADVVDGVGGEFGDEDVVVGCVPDRAADHANGEGEGCDSCDEVL